MEKNKKIVNEIVKFIEEYQIKINEEYNLIKAKSYGVKIEDNYCEALRKEFFINSGKHEAWSEFKTKILKLTEENSKV